MIGPHQSSICRFTDTGHGAGPDEDQSGDPGVGVRRPERTGLQEPVAQRERRAGYHAPASIVLLTDGDNNEEPNPLAVAQSAADEGIRIYPVGIGSAAGTTVDLDGFQVFSALDEGLLQQIAMISGGTYNTAEDAAGLEAVYDELNSSLLLRPENVELTAVFAGLAALLLLVGGLLSLVRAGYLP